jgi:catechol 2,3-dioxygenase-like lactoylglutathione lyase family enzyme
MARSLAFYRALGLQIPPEADSRGFAHVELPHGQAFEFGTYDLTRAYDPAFEPRPGPGLNCLQFRLPSRDAVDEMHARLTGLGYQGHLVPFDAYWGARYAEVLDPDGNVAGFQSPIDPARQGPPPS